MFPTASPYEPSTSRFTVSIEKVDIVVNAPNIPTNTNDLNVLCMSIPYLNMRNDASTHPTMFTMNVAQGKLASTVL